MMNGGGERLGIQLHAPVTPASQPCDIIVEVGPGEEVPEHVLKTDLYDMLPQSLREQLLWHATDPGMPYEKLPQREAVPGKSPWGSLYTGGLEKQFSISFT